MTALTSTGTTTRGRSPLNYTTTPCEDYKMDGDYSNTLNTSKNVSTAVLTTH